MAKGSFTQGFCLLTDGQTTIEDIKSALESHGFDIAKQTPAGKSWCFGGPSLTVAFLPEVNGYAAVDVVDHPWPDAMGHPQTDPMTLGAWSMGYFGPLAYPGGLERARQHSWVWVLGRTLPENHRGFVRLRISYVLGADGDALVLPENYDALAELNFLNDAVRAVIGAPGILCYFNPNGEVLRCPQGFCDLLDKSQQQNVAPLPLWSNIRFFNLDEQFAFMDTIGNGQLDIADIEAIYPHASYSPGDIDYYLRNVTHYLLDQNPELHTGEPIDGPGESNLSWTIELAEEGTVQPPRSVVRLYPTGISAAVQQALAANRGRV